MPIGHSWGKPRLRKYPGMRRDWGEPLLRGLAAQNTIKLYLKSSGPNKKTVLLKMPIR